MPIYKYSRHEIEMLRAERRHRKMRRVALVLSSLLTVGTALLVAGHYAHRLSRPSLTRSMPPVAAPTANVDGR